MKVVLKIIKFDVQDGYDGYTCMCDKGYQFSSDTCLDTDECVETPQLCTPHGQCTNTIGSYYCHCKVTIIKQIGLYKQCICLFFMYPKH